MILETILSTLITIALKGALDSTPVAKRPPAPPRPIGARVVAWDKGALKP